MASSFDCFMINGRGRLESHRPVLTDATSIIFSTIFTLYFVSGIHTMQLADHMLILVDLSINANTFGDRCLNFGLFHDWFNNSEA